MAKPRQEKSISEVAPESVDSTTELERSEDRNSALRKELSECRSAANLSQTLLASGLRLAFANEALQGEVAALRKDASTQASGQKSKQSSGKP